LVGLITSWQRKLVDPRGVYVAIWFDFEHKSYYNREIKIYIVQLFFKKLSKSNQTNAAWIDWVGAIYGIIFQYQIILNIQKKNLKFQNNNTLSIKVVYLK
jgi:hypothetical protein